MGVRLSSLSGHLSRYGRITIVIQVSAIGGRLGFRTSVLQPLQLFPPPPPFVMCRDALGMPMACRGTLGVMWRARRHVATDCATVYLLGNSFFTWHGPGPALLLPRDEPSSVACRTACRTVSFVVGEQFLGVSSCFVQCFVHNKHPRDRPPQQISSALGCWATRELVYFAGVTKSTRLY